MVSKVVNVVRYTDDTVLVTFDDGSNDVYVPEADIVQAWVKEGNKIEECRQ